MKIIINDFGCYPFILQLVKSLAQRKHIVDYMFAPFVQNPLAYHKDLKLKKNFIFHSIKIKGIYNKYNFFLRRNQEIEYGNKCWNKIFKIKPDVVICANMPLEALKILVEKSKLNKIPLILWIQDIHSEAIKKVLSKKSFLLSKPVFWYYSRIENYCIQHSKKIIAITNDFKKYFKDQECSKFTVIENWGVQQNKANETIKKKWKKKLKLNKEFVFLYAGTLSYKHDPEIFLKLSENFKDSKIIIFSEGKFAVNLKKKSITHKNLIVKKWVNLNELQSILSLADVLLVSLNKDAGEFSVPSKILNYFYSAKPILGMMPRQNLASKKIIGLKAGYIVEPGHFDVFLNKAIKLYKNKSIRKKMGLNAFNYTKKHFNIKTITTKFEKILKKVKLN